MALWDYRYLGAEEFPEALSALEIEHILRWSLLNSLRYGADVVL
jgi:hypothetical protein